MAQQRKKLGAFRAIHLLMCIGLFFWAFWFYSHHTPAREAWRNMSKAHEQKERHDRARGKAPASLAAKIDTAKARLKAILPIVLPDVLFGASVLAMFSFSTGVFVKRLEIYLKMSGSGDVASVRGVGLQGQALESNAGRRGGIQ